MRKLIFVCSTLALLAACGCAQVPQRDVTPELQAQPQQQVKQPEPAAPPKQPSEEGIKARTSQLLKGLASKDYKQRESAHTELATLLETRLGAALAQLQKARETSNDAEVKNRLERMLAPYTRWHISPAVLDAVPNIIELLEEDSRSSMRTAVEALRKFDIKDTRATLLTVFRESRKAKRRTLEALLEKPDRHVVEFFTELLSDRDSRDTAEYALRRIGELSIPFVTTVWHKSGEPELRKVSARILAGAGEKGRQVLVKALEASDSTAKKAALTAFLEYPFIAPPAEVLLRLTNDKDPKVCGPAAILLARIKHQRAVDFLASTLTSNEDAQFRRMAAHALCRIGDRTAVPALIRGLKDPNWNVRCKAAYALRLIPDKSSIEPLIDALFDPEPVVRVGANDALIGLGDKAVPQILEAFKTGDKRVRKTLASVLSRIGGKRAIALLMDALKDDDSGGRTTAASELGYSESKNVADALVPMLKDSNADVRISAAISLGQIRDKRAIGTLVELLNHKEAPVRASAVEALGEIGDKQAVKPLIERLKDTDFYVREASVEVLAKIGDKQAFGALVEFVKSKKLSEAADMEDYLAEALVRTGGKKAIPHVIRLFESPYAVSEAIPAVLRFGEATIEPLLEAAKSDKVQVKIAALEALAMLREEKAFPLLLTALMDKDYEVRYEAARIISMYKDPRAVEPLIALLDDEEQWVREKAAASLGYLGDARAVEPLVKVLLEDEDWGVSRQAAFALGKIGDETAVDSLILSLLEEVRCAAASALASFKEKRVVDSLVNALKDYDREVVSAAAKSLTQIGDKRAAEPFAKILLDTPYLGLDIVSLLGKLHTLETVNFFISVVQKDNAMEESTRQAALALGKIGDKRAVEPLRHLLKSNLMELRMAAAVALLQFGDKDAEELVREALKSKKYMNPGYAAEALAQLPSHKALPWLIEALSSKSDFGRRTAVKALAKLGGNRVTSALIAAMKDNSRWVRLAAIKGLQELGEERAIPPLIELLENDSDYDMREAAHDALEEITGQNFGWNYQRWRRWYEKSKSK